MTPSAAGAIARWSLAVVAGVAGVTSAPSADAGAISGVDVTASGRHSYRVCSTCPDQGSSATDVGGGSGVSSAAIESPVGTPYAWSAVADLNGQNLLPQLGVLAGVQHPNTVGFVSSSASARGLQEYHYTGTTSETYTITLAFDGIILGGDNESASAGLSVFGADYNPFAEFNPRLAFANFDAVAAGPGIDRPFQFTTDVSFSIAPDDIFYVSTFINASAFWADRGSATGVVDARHTLRAAFSAGNTALLAVVPPTPAAVSEPSSLAAGLIAVIALTAVRGRKMRGRAGRACRD